MFLSAVTRWTQMGWVALLGCTAKLRRNRPIATEARPPGSLQRMGKARSVLEKELVAASTKHFTPMDAAAP